MKVYLKTRRSDQRYHTLFVTPAKDSDAPDEWLDGNREPRQLQVKFMDGAAEVSSELGRWLIEKDQVRKSPGLVTRSPHVVAA